MKYYVIIVVILLCVTLSNAQTEVSGTIVNEIWILENSPYLVVGDIQVARLTIQPGVSVIFEGDYHFDIDGAITAIGEQHAQISFAADTDVESWKGILFQNSAPGSELRWCRIENANSSGIRIIDSSPVLQYCTVRLNTSYDSGGGLKIVNSQPNELLISDCTFSENQTYSNHLMARSHGSGIWVLSLDGVIRFENCRIENNLTETADGSVYGGGGYVEGNVEFSLCTIKDNTVFAHENIPGGSSHGHGGGLYIDSGDILIENSLIANNTARGTAPGGMQGNSGYAYGGAIDIENGEIIIKNSIIGSNIATSSHGTRGSGVHCANGVIAMENNTFAYNNTVAVYNTNASVRIFNTIIYFNNDNNEQLQGEFSVSYSDILGGYEGIGNINMNPVMQQLGDFHIIVEGSPCIDVGNPDPTYNDTCFPPSLGSERNDIGAHGGPGGCDWQSLNEVIEIQSQIPESYIMAQNYPNPFNSKTIIAYHLPASGVVNLTIYNILGKEIKQLVYQYQLSGNHKVIWDGSDRNGSTVSSGIYYYLIKSRDLLESNKMVLLR